MMSLNVGQPFTHFNTTVELFDDNYVLNGDFRKDSVIYVTKQFCGEVFVKLSEAKKAIISDIILEKCIKENISLPSPKYPLFNYFMKDLVICFPSPKDKKQTDVVNGYLNLIRFMGGQSRRDMKSGKSYDRTHLIESKTDSENYKFAAIYGIPIVFKEWIDFLWQNRRNPEFDASDPQHVSKFRIKPFYQLYIAFINFCDENPVERDERIEFEKLTKENGGEVVESYDQKCTHFVLNAVKGQPISFDVDKYERIPEYVVYKAWFTGSLNIKNREDEEHNQHFKNKNSCQTPQSYRSSLSRNSLSILSPTYDSSFSMDSSGISKSQVDSDKNPMEAKTRSITYHLCLELCQTENNYVNILKAIIKIFRDPLKNHQLPEQFPNEIEMKTIFGCLPPIIEVHEKILSKLETIIQNWSEDNEIGKVFLEHSHSFLTAYPQYVNYYEKTKEMIEECIEKYPKFNAFLTVSQKEPECGKQSLQELLINPIQRLPRLEMYLKALIKKTDETKSDYKSLNEALNTIIEVNKQINKEKKKTEGQIEMFDLLNDIEDCPATLLSSNRHFISKCDVKLLIQIESNDCKEINKFDNYLFTLLLFSDRLVLCKKRTLKRTSSLSFKSSTNLHPNSVGVKKNSKKSYKYIETIELENIKKIYNDDSNSDDFLSAFAILTHPSSHDRSFPAYPFIVKDQEITKEKFLAHILKTLKERLSNENILAQICFKSLDFTHANTIARSVSKSKYAIMRTKEKLNRTFSVRRQTMLPAMSLESLHVPQSTLPPSSPSSSRRLSRVFSNLLSPIGLQHRNSPRYLGSMTSLNENIDYENANFSLPTTPAPRKKKCPTNNIDQNEQLL